MPESCAQHTYIFSFKEFAQINFQGTQEYSFREHCMSAVVNKDPVLLREIYNNKP